MSIADDHAGLDRTNDPQRKSWVASANVDGNDFPIQNLPFGVFKPRGSVAAFRGGVAIGAEIVDLASLATAGTLNDDAAVAAAAAGLPRLNSLMGLGPKYWGALRQALFDGLLDGSPRRSSFEGHLVPQSQAEYAVPAQIGDYTDFYTSIHHATAVGRLFRPDNPLLPNYKWVPVGYHGRTSSIGVSGQMFHRPRGQYLPPRAAAPLVGPSRRLDYELELGVFVGPGNALGSPISIEKAESHIFGLCLLNDWSARDHQAWEYQPLGPFLSKNFATTISPWIVTLQALAPYRTPLLRGDGDPRPLAYLASELNASGGFDIQLEAFVRTAAMSRQGTPAQRTSSTSFRHAYWTIAQLITHHTVNGCNLRPGDLLGTGTQSGPTPAEAGSLLELTGGGKLPLAIGSSEQRTFLEDGDGVLFRAWCSRPGAARVGFGEVGGHVLPALDTI